MIGEGGFSHRFIMRLTAQGVACCAPTGPRNPTIRALRACRSVGAMCGKMQITTARHTPRAARVCQNIRHTLFLLTIK